MDGPRRRNRSHPALAVRGHLGDRDRANLAVRTVLNAQSMWQNAAWAALVALVSFAGIGLSTLVLARQRRCLGGRTLPRRNAPAEQVEARLPRTTLSRGGVAYGRRARGHTVVLQVAEQTLEARASRATPLVL